MHNEKTYIVTGVASGIGAEPVNGNETVSLGYGGTLTVQFVDNML